jgi:hypothetical protein
MIENPVELLITVGPSIAWMGLVGSVWLAAVLAVVATSENRPEFIGLGAVILLVGGSATAAGCDCSLPGSAVFAAQAGLVALGVAGGGPAATLVLRAASRGSAREGANGGILVGDEPGREVLRGGTTIGYLERAVVVAAVLLGRAELLAALIAIKGLGRFRDLDAGAATERFIIGTLVSLMWAGAAAGIILLA